MLNTNLIQKVKKFTARNSYLLLMCFSLSFVAPSMAQLSVFNLLEMQQGNIPDADPWNRNAVYNQFNIAYKYKMFRASTRLESYYTDDVTGGEYFLPTQWNLNFRKKGIEINTGHLYETLGRGLLLRGYEIKNSVFEDQIYRVKQGFYRDILGGSGSYKNQYFSVKGIYGDVLINQLPPDDPNNRRDNVAAGEARVNIGNQSLGGMYMQNKNTFELSEYVGLLAEGYIGNAISYYAEFDQQTNRGQKFGEINSNAAYGAYLALGYSSNGFGVSLEVKEYQNLFIGSGINDPPTLVKEQSYRTLNRSTHISDLNNERGMQLEVFYKYNDKNLFTLNFAQAVNTLIPDFKFREVFGEWQHTLSELSTIKIFVDFSEDALWLEKNRIASGVYYTFPVHNHWNLSLETEVQHLQRGFDELTSIFNSYTGLVIHYKSIVSASIIWEYTNDGIISDRSSTEKIEKSKHFPGVNLQYKANSKNTLSVFAGERRGGPACTSGICYEVLDFKGVELRWTTKF